MWQSWVIFSLVVAVAVVNGSSEVSRKAEPQSFFLQVSFVKFSEASMSLSATVMSMSERLVFKVDYLV